MRHSRFSAPTAEFFRLFFKSNGAWVAAAIFFSKLSFFLLNIFIARNLLKSELGIATQAQNFLGFFIPFIGLGSYQGLLKFGSGITDHNEHENLAVYSLSKGILGQVLMTLLMILVAAFLYHGDGLLLKIIAFFSIRFFGLFLVEIYKAGARGGFDNRKFALMELAVSTATLISTLVLVPFFGLKGLLISLCFSPYCILFFGLKKIDFKAKISVLTSEHFWKFSISTAFASLLHELFYLADIFFVGILFTENAVAEYRTASLIPLNFLLFSRIFIQADYPKLCRHHDDKAFLKKYARQFLIFFVPASIIALGFMGIFSRHIISLFGSQYYGSEKLFNIFLLPAFFGAVFRVPFSNMLFALAKTRSHILISLFSVAVLVLLVLAFRFSGIYGIAVASAIATGVSGLLYFTVFFLRLNRLK